MKYKELISQTGKELVKRKKELKMELFTAQMKNSLGQLNNPLEIRKMRRELAQVETALSQKAPL
ncbi:MAG: 50S ribosomal protein L29 [Pseudobdellovibrionaceae bacterium]